MFEFPRVACVGTLIVAGLAHAQAHEERVVVGRLGAAHGHAVSEDEAHSIAITIENGERRIVIDGEEVPAERIETQGGRMVIVLPDGERRIIPLQLDGSPGGLTMVAPGGRLGLTMSAEAAPPPNAVIGVTTRDTLVALEKHLRLEPGTTTMVASVLDGLPAHAAGLEPDDVIVAVDGQTPVAPARLRELLAAKNPGDRVVLRVIHEGREREIAVALEAFDAERMSSARRIGEPEVRVGELPGLSGEFMLPTVEGRLWRELMIDGDENLFVVPGTAAPAAPDAAVPGRRPDDVRAMELRLRELEKRLEALDRLLERLDAADAAAGKGG